MTDARRDAGDAAFRTPTGADRSATSSSVDARDATLDLLYREYVRQSDNIDAWAQGSFDDVKYLAALGALLAWPPIAESDVFDKKSHSITLLVGFLVIMFIFAILAVRDLVKQTIIRFKLDQLYDLEVDLGGTLGDPHTVAFRSVRHWRESGHEAHKRVLYHFYGLIIALLLLFPFAVLTVLASWLQGVIYVAVASVVTGAFVRAAAPLGEGQGADDSAGTP